MKGGAACVAVHGKPLPPRRSMTAVACPSARCVRTHLEGKTLRARCRRGRVETSNQQPLRLVALKSCYSTRGGG